MTRTLLFAVFLLAVVPPIVIAAPEAQETQQEQKQGMVTRMLLTCKGRAENDRVQLTLNSGKTVEARCRFYVGELLAVPVKLLALQR